MDVEEYRSELHRDLDLVYAALTKTIHLSQIFDLEWYNRVKQEIDNVNLIPHFSSEAAFMFLELRYPRRGIDRFEVAQDLFFQGKIEEASEEQKLAFYAFGPDPLKTLLPLMDQAGQARFVLGAQSDGATVLSLFDQLNTVRASLGVESSGTPCLNLFDELGSRA